MPPRVLTVEPTGGLCNRMRVVDSAATLAERFDVLLTVLWTRTPDLRARFRDLFEPLEGVRIFENAWTTSRAWRRSLGALGYYDPYLTQASVEALLSAGDDLDGALAGRRPFVITCSRLAPTAAPLRRFLPAASLRRQIESLTRRFPPATAGVHIRRRDHVAGRVSTTEGFIAWMRAELEVEPETHFFLATDAAEVEERLEGEFPGRIMRQAKCYDRNRPEGVRAAVVDLFSLARTRKIAGTYFSSFSEAAGVLGEVDLVVIGQPR